MNNPLEVISAIEIDTSGGTYYTTAYGTVQEVKAAIDREEAFTCYWIRADGTRFEELFYFNPEIIKMIRTNKT